jgi:hypothetical protein
VAVADAGAPPPRVHRRRYVCVLAPAFARSRCPDGAAVPRLDESVLMKLLLQGWWM